jgi:ABC-type polysaccharide/polyol phosphate transport system ATPase subunit
MEVAGVWKSFQTHTRIGVKELLLKGRAKRPGRFSRHWALKDVSFVVKRGQAFGIVGHNGAGKSTLLDLLLGTMKPDRGSISAHGKVGGLLDLGAGFHPELNGRENILLYGSILGMPLAEIRAKLPRIVEFSELRDAIEEPIRTYSAGMVARLGFSTIIHARSDVLLVDEVLAVGDARFQQKCIEFIHEFRRKNGALVIVSHERAVLEAMCDEAMCLHLGEMRALGPTTEVLEEYNRLLNANTVEQA